MHPLIPMVVKKTLKTLRSRLFRSFKWKKKKLESTMMKLDRSIKKPKQKQKRQRPNLKKYWNYMKKL